MGKISCKWLVGEKISSQGRVIGEVGQDAIEVAGAVGSVGLLGEKEAVVEENGFQTGPLAEIEDRLVGLDVGALGLIDDVGRRQHHGEAALGKFLAALQCGLCF